LGADEKKKKKKKKEEEEEEEEKRKRKMGGRMREGVRKSSLGGGKEGAVGETRCALGLGAVVGVSGEGGDGTGGPEKRGARQAWCSVEWSAGRSKRTERSKGSDRRCLS